MKISKYTPFYSKNIFQDSKDKSFIRVKKHKNKIYIESIERSKMSPSLKCYAFFSNIFGLELRKLSKVLRSKESKALIATKSPTVQAHIKENVQQVNKRISKLNKKIFLGPKIQVIQTDRLFPASKPKKVSKSKKDAVPPRVRRRAGQRIRFSEVAKPTKPLYSLDYLKAFYRNEGKDNKGRYLLDMWKYSNSKKEKEHDYIQWLFPLTEKSPFNSAAPVLTSEMINELKKDPIVIENMKMSFKVMLRFYGFKQRSNGKIVRTKSFQTNRKNWLSPGNHNHRRISRMLKCLRLYGLENEAQEFYKRLDRTSQVYPTKFTKQTLKVWADDVKQ